MTGFPVHAFLGGPIFFDGWVPIVRTLICGAIAYVGLILLLRLSGKRTLSKWNAFDFAITVAFGSTIASILLSKDVSITQGLVALALLVLLQFGVTWLSVRWSWFSHLVKAEPSLLVYRGQFQLETMQRQRVTKSEVRGALRSHGVTTPDETVAVVLESDGSFSVITDTSDQGSAALHDVPEFARREQSEHAQTHAASDSKAR